MPRAVQFLGQRRHIERMQVLDDAAADFRLGNHVQRTARRIDDRSSRDSDLRNQITAIEIRRAVTVVPPAGIKLTCPYTVPKSASIA